MTGRKIVYLMLALVLPVFVFLFLKFFGKNEFAVQPLLQESVAISSDCGTGYKFPYVIPDSIVQEYKTNEHELTVLSLLPDHERNEVNAQLKRIKEEFSVDPIHVISIIENENENIQLKKKCVFLMPEETSVVLIDKAGRIRGQYDGASLDEMDRLIVEMKVILKKY